MYLAIYGAQAIALGAYEAMCNLYPEKEIRCFLVTERGMNAENLCGIPVYELKTYAQGLTEKEKNEMEVLIATPETVMGQIEDSLDKAGILKHERLTSVKWAQLMSRHYATGQEFAVLQNLPLGKEKAALCVYMAKFYKDMKLTGEYEIPDWITPVQVGAALCEERVTDLLDCTGDNISEKNRNYCELTALYWAWKNGMVLSKKNSDWTYYGLCHYRRILELADKDLLRLIENKVDAVLPYPMPYEPSIQVHHERYIKEADWKALLMALKELSPEYAEVFGDILEQRYLYNYNIMILRAPVFEEYCAWLFPILERIERLSEPKGCERADRYIGYMGETLSTLYFMANKEKLKITHAGCRFLT